MDNSTRILIASIAQTLGFGAMMFGFFGSMKGLNLTDAACMGFGIGLVGGSFVYKYAKKPRLIANLAFIVVGGGMLALGVVPSLGMIFLMVGVGHLVSLPI